VGYADWFSLPGPNRAQQWSAAPIPPYARIADPQEGTGVWTDAETTIISNNTLFEFWKARKVNGQWQACWAAG